MTKRKNWSELFSGGKYVGEDFLKDCFDAQLKRILPEGVSADYDYLLEEWAAKYRPVRKDNGLILAYGTSGKSLEEVRQQDPHQIWTLIGDEDGDAIKAGFHMYNRLNYFITELPWEDDDIWVWLYEDDFDRIYFS